MLFDALAGRSREVRDDDAGLRSESDGRGDGDTAPDMSATRLRVARNYVADVKFQLQCQ